MRSPAIPDLAMGPTVRPEVRGRRAAVAAGKPPAVAAGLRVFERGGNAIDAGLAAVLAAAVTEISHFGFGGECPILVHEGRTGRSYVIPGLGPAPAAARREMFEAQGFIDGNGPRACTVPAVLDAVCLALATSGTRRLAEVLGPARELAHGFPMYETLRRHLLAERDACARFPSTVAAYYAQGVPAAGELFRQPDLAATFEELIAAERAAGDGRADGIEAARRAFYAGDVGARLAAAVRDAGGLLDREDLARYRGALEEPTRGSYRGHTILKGGFWCQGPALLQALHILDRFDVRREGLLSADAIHLAIEAIKLAFDDRDAHYGDPERSTIPAELLSAGYAASRARLIDRAAAAVLHRPGLGGRMPHAGGAPAAAGDTTSVCTADADGNLLCAVPSSGWLLGGAFVAAGTGIPLGNRMQSFVLDVGSPNVLAPSKRPRMTLTPSIVLRDGRPLLAIGTPGGDSQDQQILNVLVNLLDFGLPLQRAIEVPRFNSEHMQSSFGRHEDQPGACTLEEAIPEAVRQALSRRGHGVRVVPRFGMGTGITAAGLSEAGTVLAGADPRGERDAAAL